MPRRPEIYCGKHKISPKHRREGETEDKEKKERDVAATLMIDNI